MFLWSLYEKIKAKKNKMGIIGNGMDIRSAMGKLFSSAGGNNCYNFEHIRLKHSPTQPHHDIEHG